MTDSSRQNEETERGSPVRLRSAGWLLAGQAGLLLLSFPLSVLLARVLGPEGKGQLSVSQMVVTVAIAFMNLGLPAALVYFSARNAVSGRSVISLAALVSASFSVLALVAAVPFAHFIADRLIHVDDERLVYLIALLIAPSLYAQIVNGAMFGKGHVRETALLNVSSVFLQVVADGGLAILGWLNTMTAIGVWAVSLLVPAAGGTFLAWKDAEGPGLRVVETWRLARSYALRAWASGTLSFLSLRQDTFFVSYFHGAGAVGVYSIAVTLAELSWQAPRALGGILTPKVARLDEGSVDLTSRLTRITLPTALVTAILTAVLAPVLIPLVFGRPFSGAVLPLVALLPGVLASSVASMPANHLLGVGHPADWTRASLANLVTNSIGNLLLVPRYGAIGAALASSVSYSVQAATVIYYFTMRTGSDLRTLFVPRRQDWRELSEVVRRGMRRIAHGTGDGNGRA